MNTFENKFDRLINGKELNFVEAERKALQESIDRFNEKAKDKVKAVATADLLGRKQVVSDTDTISLDKLRNLLAQEEKEENPAANVVHGLVNIRRMLNVAELAIAMDPTAKETYSLVNALVSMVTNMTTKAKSENAYHYAFGGKIVDREINSPSDLEYGSEVQSVLASIGEDLLSFAPKKDALKKFADDFILPEGKVEEYRNLVRVAPNKVTVTGKGGFSCTLSWRDIAKKVEYAGQTVFATIGSDGTAKLYSAKQFSLLVRVATMHASAIDIEGLKEHPNAFAVILSKASAKGKTQAEWIKVPFGDKLDQYQLNQEEGIKSKVIGDALKTDGFVPFYKKEVYSKHGLVMYPETIVQKGNAFCQENGLSQDDYSKLIVRLAKCAQAEHKFEFKTTTHLIALCDDSEVKMTQTQSEFNARLVRGLVDGHAISSRKQHEQLGACRVVSGSLPDETGQKTMLADSRLTQTEKAMAAVTAVLGHKGIYTIAGLSSTKAKSAKKKGTMVLVETIFAGQTVKFWIKSVKEKLLITDSAVSESFELNPGNLPKLEGMAAALDTYERRIMGKKSETVFQLLYNNRSSSINLVEAVEYLVAKGTIRLKDGKARTNSQFITALETQFSREVGESVMNSLVRQNKAKDYRKAVGLSTDILRQELAGVTIDAFDVDMVEFAEMLFSTQASFGEVFENASQQIFNTETVLGMSEYLLSEGKEYVRFFANGKSCIIGLSKSMFDSVEAVERDGYCKVSGLLAEVLFAINSGLVRATSETANDVEVNITPAIAEIMVERIALARDNHLGKELTRVPVEGCNGHVIGSPLLHGNELFSCGAITSMAKACKSFRETVVALYFKSPILWEGSLTVAQIVRQAEMFRIISEQGEGLHHFNWDWKEFAILNGKAMYQSPEKIVGNGNDSDGDRSAVAFVPLSAVAAFKPYNKKLGHKHVVDAMNPTIAVGGVVAKAKWDNEVEGLYHSSLSDKVSYKTVEMSSEDFVKGMSEAVLSASSETKNVAMYTTFQSQVQMNKPAFVSGFCAFVTADAEAKMFTGVKARKEISTPLVGAGLFALETFASVLHSFVSDVQGTIVNIDAMDQIKHSDNNKVVVKLAELLNPKRVYNATQDIEDANGDSKKRSVKGGNTSSYNKIIDTVKRVIFNKDSHNLSIDRLIDILPQGVDIEVLQDYVVRAMVASIASVGEVLTNATSYSSILIKDHDISLETALGNAKALDLSSTKDTSLIGYTLKVAYAHKGEKLITVSKKNGNKITK